MFPAVLTYDGTAFAARSIKDHTVESDYALNLLPNLIVIVFFSIFTLQIPSNLPDAIAARLEDFNAIAGNPITYELLGQTDDETSAILYLEPISRATGEPYPGVVDWGAATLTNSAWTIYLPGDPGYTAAYERISPSVLSRADSTPYIIRADPAFSDVEGYQLPWADATWATVTRSYRQHGTGRIDFDISQREITAAKDGIIVYANDTHSTNAYSTDAWWYWNTIIIQHSEHEFSLYGHIEPDSIPQWIKDACTEDLSVANCFVPITAGDTIAFEGSTGYSSNPHLHLEFGQRFGVAAYMDVADEDSDGVRAEPMYAGYIYAEQNVGLSGYTSTEVAAWQFGTLQQATHRPAPPIGINLLQNGDFNADTQSWEPSGQLNWEVADGTLRITRLQTSDPPDWASFYQDVENGVPAHTPFEASLRLGNSSSIAKTVTVSVFNRYGKQYGLFECAFVIPANAPLTLYTIRGSAVNTWASLRFLVSVNPPDGAPAALVDDISLQVLTEPTSDQCITPTS